MIFDVAHNTEGVASFINFIQSFNCQNKRLILSLQSRKNIVSQSSRLIDFFDDIILCETHNKRTMKLNELKSNFKSNKKIICIQSEYDAIQYALKDSKSNDLVAIIGTHYFGDAMSEIFNISFNLL